MHSYDSSLLAKNDQVMDGEILGKLSYIPLFSIPNTEPLDGVLKQLEGHSTETAILCQ